MVYHAALRLILSLDGRAPPGRQRRCRQYVRLDACPLHLCDKGKRVNSSHGLAPSPGRAVGRGCSLPALAMCLGRAGACGTAVAEERPLCCRTRGRTGPREEGSLRTCFCCSTKRSSGSYRKYGMGRRRCSHRVGRFVYCSRGPVVLVLRGALEPGAQFGDDVDPGRGGEPGRPASRRADAVPLIQGRTATIQ